MKIVLVDNLVMPENGSPALMDVHPHLGLLALAAAAQANGDVVSIYDPKRSLRCGRLAFDETLYERAAGDLLSRTPDLVGFTTLGCSFIFVVNVARVLKREHPELPIVLGGPHATMLDRLILERFSQFDVIMRHEADETFGPMLQNIEGRRFNSIPGVSWRTRPGGGELRFTDGQPKVEDLDSLPIYDYDHYPVAELGLDLLRVEAGRGCPFACTFCSTSSFFQRSFRLKSAGRLVAELDALHARYGFTEFKLDHDMFTVNRRKVIDFCEAVRGRRYRWRASARIDCVDAELLSIMATAGCVGLYFGIETGSARMQQVSRKCLDLADVLPILHAAHERGIRTTASFITGYPEEKQQDQNETLDMLGRCYSPSCLAQLHPLAPEPGTPLFERLGSTIAYDGYGGRYNAELVTAGDRGLVLRYPDLFQTYYYYPSSVPRERTIFAVETIDLLRRAGPTMVAYLLRAYGGMLSVFVQTLRDFADARGAASRPTAALLESYVGERFGPAHHLTSWFRYALRANELPPAESGALEVVPFAHDIPYRVGPRVHLLDGLHDCSSMLARVTADRDGTSLLNDSEFGERGTYLLRAAGPSSTCFRIDDGVARLLSLFDVARTYAEVSATVGLDPAAAPGERNAVYTLVSNRILVPVGTV